jgi:hypothetical protein
MARSVDRDKAAAWRQRFRRFSRSGLTVARFCAKEGVSPPSFYYWQKMLARKPSTKPSKRRTVRQARRRPQKSRSFQPVTVMPASAGLAIHLPHGARIDVPTGNIEIVRTVVHEVVRADQAFADGGTPC